MIKTEKETVLRQHQDSHEGGTRHDGSSPSSTPCARAREGGFVSVEERMQIRGMYYDATGYEMQPFVERMVCEYLGRGMELEVILHAIELTGWAPRPSAHYLRAILRRYEDNDIWTEADVERDEWRRSREREIHRAHFEADQRDAALRRDV